MLAGAHNRTSARAGVRNAYRRGVPKSGLPVAYPQVPPLGASAAGGLSAHRRRPVTLLAANSLRPPQVGMSILLRFMPRRAGRSVGGGPRGCSLVSVSYTHLRAHETRHDLVCRLL